MTRLVLTPYAISLANVGLRGLQVLTSLIGLATMAAGFNGRSDGYLYRLGSHESNFLLLTTYTAMMYAAWFLVFVEIYPMVVRPLTRTTRAIDATLALFLLIAASCLAASDYVSNCGVYGNMIHCSNIKTAVAFAFLAIVPFCGSIGMTFVQSTAETELTAAPIGYMVETTPTGASPKGVAPPTPSSKV